MRAEGMAVPGSGINEELPVACAGVAENALLHDGTATIRADSVKHAGGIGYNY